MSVGIGDEDTVLSPGYLQQPGVTLDLIRLTDKSRRLLGLPTQHHAHMLMVPAHLQLSLQFNATL